MSRNILDVNLLDSTTFSAPSKISALSQQRSWSRSDANTTTTSTSSSIMSSTTTTTHTISGPSQSKRKRPSNKKEDTWDPNFVLSLATHLPPSLKPTLVKIAKSDAALDDNLIQQLKFKQPILPAINDNSTSRRKRKLEEFEEEQAEIARKEEEAKRKKDERERKRKCREMDAVLGLNPLKGMMFEEREPFERKTRNSKGGRKVVLDEKRKIVEEEEQRKRKMREMDKVLGLLPKMEEKVKMGVEKEEEDAEIPDSQDEGSKADSLYAEYESPKNPLELQLLHSGDTKETVTTSEEVDISVSKTTTTITTTDVAAAKEQSDASSIKASTLKIDHQVGATRDTMVVHGIADGYDHHYDSILPKRNFDIVIYKKPIHPATALETPRKRGRGRPRKHTPASIHTPGKRRRDTRPAARMYADGGFGGNSLEEDNASANPEEGKQKDGGAAG